MAHVITSGDRINVISSGRWILSDRNCLNDVARSVVNVVYSGFNNRIDAGDPWLFDPLELQLSLAWLTKKQKYPIQEFYITSMERPGDSADSPHHKDRAVDFVIKPYYLMPVIFNDLAKLYDGSNIYIAAPLNGGSVNKHIHYDHDFSHHKNLKAIEFEETARTKHVAPITQENARKVLAAYGLPEHYHNEEQVYQKAVNDLADTRSGYKADHDAPPPLPELFDWEKFLKQCGAVAILGYGSFKLLQMFTSGELKSSKSKKRRA